MHDDDMTQVVLKSIHLIEGPGPSSAPGCSTGNLETDLDCTINLGRLHSACRIEGARNLFHNVHKDLVPPPAARPVGVQNGLDDACGALANGWQQIGGAVALQHMHLPEPAPAGCGVPAES